MYYVIGESVSSLHRESTDSLILTDAYGLTLVRASSTVIPTSCGSRSAHDQDVALKCMRMRTTELICACAVSVQVWEVYGSIEG